AGGKLMILTANKSAVSPEENAASADYVQLSVRDSGEGMPEDVRKKATEPFFTTKPLGHGTGLGLSMALGYVRQSNGYLDIESQLGKGTTITILMPRHRESPESRL